MLPILLRVLPVLVTLCILLLIMLTVTTLHAQSLLRRSDPAANTMLHSAPAEVMLWFAEPILPGSRISVLDDQFGRLERSEARVDSNDPRLLRVRVDSLLPGRYTVNWQITTQFGQAANGSYDFKISFASVSQWGLPILAVGMGVLTLTFVGLGVLRGIRWIRRRAVR